MPRYEFFENKKVKDKKSEEEADDEIETSGDDDIIYFKFLFVFYKAKEYKAKNYFF